MGMWATRDQNPPSYSQHAASALGRNTSQGQVPKKKSLGHAILSLTPTFFQYFIGKDWLNPWSPLRKRVLLHTNAWFHCSNSEKHHYTRKYFEQTLKCCPEHGWTCNDFLNQRLRSKKEGEGEASFHSNCSWEVFESCQQEKCMSESHSALLGN